MNENVNPTFSIVSGNNGAFQISKTKESSNDSFPGGLITITNKTLLTSGSTYNLGVRIYDSATGKNSTTTVIVHVATNTQTVYFDSSASSGGDGSYGSPYTSLSSIGSWNYLPGKVYLLKRGDSFNSSIDIHNSNINQQNPVVFGAYDQGNRPILDGTSSGDTVGISIGIWNSKESMSYIYIQNLEIKNWVNNAIANGQQGGHNHISFLDIYVHDCGDECGGSWFLWAKNYNDPTNLYITVTNSEVGHSVYAGTKWYAEGMRIYNFSCHDSEGTCMRFVSVDTMIEIPGDKACFGCVFRNNNVGVQMRTSRSQLKYFKIYDSLWNGIDIWFADSAELDNLSENFLVENGIISGSRNSGIEIWGRIKDIIVKNVDISGVYEGAGINILGYEGLTSNITVENSTIKNNADQGIFISDKNSAGGSSYGVYILNNIISNNAKGGILADYVRGLTITGNTFSGNTGQAIQSDSQTATGVVVSGNTGN
jgi:parallel beta-helix repeat protein